MNVSPRKMKDSLTLNHYLWMINSDSWTYFGARPSGSLGTSLTRLKHLQSTSRQVISSMNYFSVFSWGVEVGGI